MPTFNKVVVKICYLSTKPHTSTMLVQCQYAPYGGCLVYQDLVCLSYQVSVRYRYNAVCSVQVVCIDMVNHGCGKVSF